MDVVIIDYDDCIFPTTAILQIIKGQFPGVVPLNCVHIMDLKQEHWHNKAWDDMEESVVTAISKFLVLSKVFIVTNSCDDWASVTCEKYMPKLYTFIKQKEIPILSARDKFSKTFPDMPTTWKHFMFREILQKHLLGLRHVFSLGDSPAERKAIMHATGELGLIGKSIKFAETPNTEQLQNQWSLISNLIDILRNHEGYLDLMLTVPPPPSGQPT